MATSRLLKRTRLLHKVPTRQSPLRSFQQQAGQPRGDRGRALNPPLGRRNDDCGENSVSCGAGNFGVGPVPAATGRIACSPQPEKPVIATVKSWAILRWVGLITHHAQSARLNTNNGYAHQSKINVQHPCRAGVLMQEFRQAYTFPASSPLPQSMASAQHRSTPLT